MAASQKKYEICYSYVAQGNSSLTAATENYYRFTANVGTITINLPAVPTDGYSHSIFFKFTTGTSPNITWRVNGGTTGLLYYSDFAIEASKTYEINALSNGSEWIIAYATIG